MAASGKSFLFDEEFEVTALNPGGKKFERVSRIKASGVTYDLDLLIDVFTEAYPMNVKESFSMVLHSTVDMQGKPDSGKYEHSSKATLIDQYDYCMHGKIYRCEHVGEHKLAVYVSYGGLLMKLVGEQRHLQSLDLDSQIYCLIRKVV